jgi:hypothetical protein
MSRSGLTEESLTGRKPWSLVTHTVHAAPNLSEVITLFCPPLDHACASCTNDPGIMHAHAVQTPARMHGQPVQTPVQNLFLLSPHSVRTPHANSACHTSGIPLLG